MSASYFEDTGGRHSPWGAGPPAGPGQREPVREPMFNAPWPAIALVALIVGGYALQSALSTSAVNALWGYSPAHTEGVGWVTVVTAIFLHGNWTHALMNAAFGLAFATPLARFLGLGSRGVLAFWSFYLFCGVASNLVFGLIHPQSPGVLVGASGAVSGLMGAAARLMAGQGWRVGPILSRPVLSLGGAWIAVNLLVALIGSQFFPGAGDASIAWEAHIAGFLLGVLAVTPFAWLAGRR